MRPDLRSGGLISLQKLATLSPSPSLLIGIAEFCNRKFQKSDSPGLRWEDHSTCEARVGSRPGHILLDFTVAWRELRKDGAEFL